MASQNTNNLLQELQHLNAQQLRRLLVEHLTKQKLGLYWESNAIERDAALNANVVLPRLVPEISHTPNGITHHRNLIIEGDNFDSLRLLRATHAGKVRVIYIDPPYNTGNKDWVYNDKFVGANDRWRHSQWLEFLYQRLTLARELLTSDGVILVSINDETRATSHTPCGWFALSMTTTSTLTLWCACGITRLMNLCSGCWRPKMTPKMPRARPSIRPQVMARSYS